MSTYLVDTYVNRGLTITHGDGIYLFDQQQTPYLDFMTQYGVAIFGYNHPHITNALNQQLARITTLHGSFSNPIRTKAAYQLINRCQSGLTEVYFSNSGTEAIEAAIKFAVLSTGKKHFIVADHGYHGKTLGALSLTASPTYQRPFTPLLWDVQTIPFNSPSLLEQAITDSTAAFVVEPIQGEGGIFVPDPHYLQSIRAICDRHNILLIVDEIQTGCGRTGNFLASHDADIAIDILCLGKGLAGGIPVGATLISEQIAKAIPKHIHTSTFGGNPLACAGIVATVQLITPELLHHISTLGDYVRAQLQSLNTPSIIDVRGKGLMIGIQVKEDRNQILKQLQTQHILAIPAGEDVIRLLPPYIITKQDIDRFIQVLNMIFQNNS